MSPEARPETHPTPEEARVATTGKDRPYRSRRSCLAVPGSSEKMLGKAQGLNADQVFLDLEDSVAPDVKADAREQVASALKEGDWGDKVRVVRVNDVSTQWCHGDISTVVSLTGPDYLDCIMVPKVEDAAQVHFVDHLLRQIELENGWEVGAIGLEIQIENGPGLINATEILAASERVETFIFGPGDMAAALNMPSLTVGAIQPDYPGDHWHWVNMTILVNARNAGVQAIDGPYAQIRDLDGFREVATRSRVLGFDGKWVLHPGQIEAANEVYGVSQEDYERAEDILAAYEHATGQEKKGAVMFGDEMIDEATRKMAEVNAMKGRREGLEVREVPDEVPFHERADWREENA
jgi:citrate lyase subunit beta / citryl-CoA lyase